MNEQLISLYLGKTREQLVAQDRGDLDLSDQISDELEEIWLSLTAEDQLALDVRVRHLVENWEVTASSTFFGEISSLSLDNEQLGAPDWRLERQDFQIVEIETAITGEANEFQYLSPHTTDPVTASGILGRRTATWPNLERAA